MSKIGFVLSLFVLLIFGTVPSFACRPTATPSPDPMFTPVPPPNLTDFVQLAPIIFVGSVLGDVDGASRGIRYEIEVDRYLKGNGYNIVQIDGYGYGTDCLPLIWENSQRIFFVYEQMNSADIPVYRLIVDYPLTASETVSTITGQSNPAQSWPLYIQLSRTIDRGDLTWLYLPLIIFMSLVALLVLCFSFYFRNRRKPKTKRSLTD